jgi:hypothetical protein
MARGEQDGRLWKIIQSLITALGTKPSHGFDQAIPFPLRSVFIVVAVS